MRKGWRFEGDGAVKCDGWDIDPPDDQKRYSIDDNSWKFWFCFVVEAVKAARGPLRNPFTTAGPRVRWPVVWTDSGSGRSWRSDRFPELVAGTFKMTSSRGDHVTASRTSIAAQPVGSTPRLCGSALAIGYRYSPERWCGISVGE